MKVGYSKTYPILGKDQWEKIWLEDDITGNAEDVRKAQYALKKQVESFHFESNKAEEKQQAAAKVKLETDVVTDGQWMEVKKKLMSIKDKKEAQEYLNTTDFAMTIEAKQIINSKAAIIH